MRRGKTRTLDDSTGHLMLSTTNGDHQMRNSIGITLALAVLVIPFTSMAQERGPTKPPPPLLREIVQGMPKGEKQEVRVIEATLKPGEMTPFHSHRFPVTVYVLEGTFTLEMEGRAPVTAKAGQAIVEPPQVKMTGYNRSSTERMRVVIFYVSDPDTPFLDLAHH
jgi:quercetin dioxygenase-like cupin family protein